jgi:sigma-B regulation protein RsbU (phosphoserine phosphatase)
VLIASMVKLAGTSQRDKAADPSSVLTGMNAASFGNTQNQLLTAAYVHLDSESRELRYSAAGHPPMLLLRDGKVTEVVENRLMLAAFDFTTYSNAVQRLQSGDRLLLYTDGLVEAANARENSLGRRSRERYYSRQAGLRPPMRRAGLFLLCSRGGVAGWWFDGVGLRLHRGGLVAAN